MSTKTPTKTTTTTTAKAEKTEEASIKSNLNSVSDGCNLSTFKRHITTCLQRWRHPSSRKHSKKSKANSSEHQQHQQQQQHQEENQCPCQQHSGKWFRKYTRKEFFGSFSSTGSSNTSFVQRTTVYCKTLNAKLHRVLSTHPSSYCCNTNRKDIHCSTSTIDLEEGPHEVEIVAKLLSKTLTATADSSTSTSSFFGQRRGSNDSAYHSIQDRFEFCFESSVTSSTGTEAKDCVEAMTITDLTFLEIRDEYPDLDSEVRSILTARAQDGATISEIRDDYRKLTGLTFPVYESITDFLLSIPYVSAYCNEKGTRIFNIRPMEKTKHIHNMVLHQKTPNESVPKMTNHHRRYREHQRNTNYYPSSYKRQHHHHNHHHLHQQDHQLQPKQQQQQFNPFAVVTENLALNVCNDNNLSHDHSEGFVEDNWFYNDNCNYLLNRMRNQETVPTTFANQPMAINTDIYTMNGNLQQAQQLIDAIIPVPQSTVDLNNFNVNNVVSVPTYENNINHLNNLFQIQEQPENPSNNENIAGTVVNTRRSTYVPHKSSMPRSSRSSSPTAKSCYTNDSLFTDTDYEAHLLDFLLMGDDFFLYMARMELRCKFKKNQKILQSGLCVSGQTINAAIKRISSLSNNGRSIIINIGSVNIMQGRQLIQIEHEYRELVTTMVKKGIKPILTTLAPLANYSHNTEMKRTLERFNKFIKREGESKNLIVIDIWKCLVNEKGSVMFDCYQNEPRTVTGAVESYLFWNNIGRQRVLQLIESQLEY